MIQKMFYSHIEYGNIKGPYVRSDSRLFFRSFTTCLWHNSWVWFFWGASFPLKSCWCHKAEVTLPRTLRNRLNSQIPSRVGEFSCTFPIWISLYVNIILKTVGISSASIGYCGWRNWIKKIYAPSRAKWQKGALSLSGSRKENMQIETKMFPHTEQLFQSHDLKCLNFQ